MSTRLGVAVVSILVAGCSVLEDAHRDPSPDGDGLGGTSELRAVFRDGEAVTGVPAEILATMSYATTRLRMVGSDEAGHGAAPAVGLMALETTGARSAERAAELAGVDVDEVARDPRASVRAAAALLADLAGEQLPVDRSSWHDALIAFGGGGEAGRAFAGEVERHLASGWRGRDAAGDALTMSARPVDVDDQIDGDDVGRAQRGLGYPGAIWNPAYSGNYQAGSRGAAQISHIVIHTVQGSYNGAISWFKNPDANVSSHYVVRSSDGQVTQMVDDSDVAWHDACFNSQTIGIEHEGYVQDPDAWYTEAMYTRSAELTAWLADKYGVPKDHAHILGHGEAPDCSDHTDPGGGWKWNHFISLVQNGGQPSFAAGAGLKDTPEQMVAGEERVVWFEFVNDSNVTWGLNETRLGTAEPQDRESAFFVDGNWLSSSRASGADHSDYTPGSTGRFTFMIRAPEVTEPTTFVESFQLVQEGVAWFGPVVSMSIEVTPRAGDGEGGGEGPDDSDDDEASDPPDGAGEGSGMVGGCAAGGQAGGAGTLCAILLLGAVVLRARRRPRRRLR